MVHRKLTNCLMVAALVASTAASAQGPGAKGEAALTKALTQSGIVVPAGGLTEACSGFRNVGQCVAALRTATRLTLPGGFPALKGLMTGQDALSLGDAIAKLNANPVVDTQP